jgi:hypothetical protein
MKGITEKKIEKSEADKTNARIKELNIQKELITPEHEVTDSLTKK